MQESPITTVFTDLSLVVTESPSPTADRTLKLVTKSVQNLANLVEFRSKEPFMTSLNPFIVRNTPRMKTFVDEIAVSDTL